MMRLQPPALARSDAGQAATAKLLETHQALAKFYDERCAQQNPAYQLRKADLDQIDPSLRENVVFGTEVVYQLTEGEDPQWVSQQKRMVGFDSGAFSSAIYSTSEIKNALIVSHAGRCAYCESYLRHVDHGDVEHFRPKAGVVERSSEGLNRDAYFWLAYEPSNLFLACKICNEVYKGNQFPILGDRLAPGNFDVAQEAPMLIDPYREDPRDFIRFNPIDGRAYEFDLYAAFLGGKEQAQERIWADPLLIEQVRSSPEFDFFLSSLRDPNLRRGRGTISLFNLNRPELLRARVSHLRHLRALLWTSWHAGGTGDVGHAKARCADLIDPLFIDLVPEYHSLTADALSTWALLVERQVEPRVAQQQDNAIDVRYETNPWIPAYDNFLQEFEHKGAEDTEADPSTYNDAISYFVPVNERRETGYRRLVYTSDKDKLYGVPEDQADGYYVAVQWEEEQELERDVRLEKLLKSGLRTETMKLKDFLKIETKSLYHKFDKSTVIVNGPFTPLF